MPTGQTKGTILPYLSNNCAIGMKMTKEPERDAKNDDGDERQKEGMARIPGIDDGKKPTTKSVKSSTKRGGGQKSRNGKCLVKSDSSQPGIRKFEEIINGNSHENCRFP